VKTRWLPEIMRHTAQQGYDKENCGLDSNRIILLVGTQSDLRSNFNILLHLAQIGEAPVQEIQALKMADKIGAIGYVECSGVTKMNLKVC